MSNLENEKETFIFYRYSKALERVSIRNAKWRDNATDNIDVVPQNALIKFVRNISISALVPKGSNSRKYGYAAFGTTRNRIIELNRRNLSL
jgi:hypothetical protein